MIPLHQKTLKYIRSKKGGNYNAIVTQWFFKRGEQCKEGNPRGFEDSNGAIYQTQIVVEEVAEAIYQIKLFLGSKLEGWQQKIGELKV